MASVAERNPATASVAVVIGAAASRAPLLASGVLTVAAMLAIASTVSEGWELREGQPRTVIFGPRHVPAISTP